MGCALVSCAIYENGILHDFLSIFEEVGQNSLKFMITKEWNHQCLISAIPKKPSKSLNTWLKAEEKA